MFVYPPNFAASMGTNRPVSVGAMEYMMLLMAMILERSCELEEMTVCNSLYVSVNIGCIMAIATVTKKVKYSFCV